MTVLRATTTDSRDRAGFVSLAFASASAQEFTTPQWSIESPDPGVLYPGDLYVLLMHSNAGNADTGAGGYPTLGALVLAGNTAVGLEPAQFTIRAFAPTVATELTSTQRRWNQTMTSGVAAAVAASLVFRRHRASGTVLNDVIGAVGSIEVSGAGTPRTSSRAQPRVLSVGIRGQTAAGGTIAFGPPDSPLWANAYNSGSGIATLCVETRTFTERGTTVQPARTLVEGNNFYGPFHALFHIRAP